ncbi:mannosyl-oligosaccharide alpha-1,2-mannosidase, partial [Paragonimus westermani]
TFSLQDHLVCFLPGTLAYGVYHGLPRSHLVLAEKLMRSCYEMYNFTSTHLGPEIVYFTKESNAKTDIQIQPADRHSFLRPEVMESLFCLYYITKNPVYREWGKNIFQAFETYAKLPVHGYAGLWDVTNPNSKHIDKMDSFWLAETLKYAYLLFNETAAVKLSFSKWVFNTEGHPLPISETATFVSDIYDKFNRI